MPAFPRTRVALGFLLAPFAGIFVLSLFVCVGGPDALARFVGCIGEMFPFLAWLGFYGAYPATLLLGVPLFFVLKRYNQLRPVPLALAGLAVGLAATALFWVFAKRSPSEMMVWLIPFAVRAGIVWAGPIAGLVFWGVAVFRNSAFSGLPATPQRR